jgi:hypothetical protein
VSERVAGCEWTVARGWSGGASIVVNGTNLENGPSPSVTRQAACLSHRTDACPRRAPTHSNPGVGTDNSASTRQGTISTTIVGFDQAPPCFVVVYTVAGPPNGVPLRPTYTTASSRRSFKPTLDRENSTLASGLTRWNASHIVAPADGSRLVRGIPLMRSR